MFSIGRIDTKVNLEYSSPKKVNIVNDKLPLTGLDVLDIVLAIETSSWIY